MQDWVESCGYPEYREALNEGQVNGAALLGMSSERLQTELILPSTELAGLLHMEIGELKERRGLFASSAERNEFYQAHHRIDVLDVSKIKGWLGPRSGCQA